MYFPKSQIQTNLYSGGELKVRRTGKSYVGFYWATSNNKFYAGKTPDTNITQIELIKGGSDAASNSSELEPYEVGSVTTSAYNFNTKTVDYLRIKGIKSVKAPRPPKHMPPTITEENYEVGEITRYFCQRNKQTLFIEINEKDFDLIFNKSKKIQSDLYRAFTLPWVISGVEEEVALENKKAVEYRELAQGAIGLGEYLKHNYLQFYALYTSGGEFLLPNGDDYVGFYHIHPNQGPMVGARHTPTPHALLTRINSNQNPSSNQPSLQSSNIYTQNNQGGTIGY